MTLNIHGHLLDLSRPLVMGIINVTPDSFYSGSRVSGCEEIRSHAAAQIESGAALLDLGGYSSRPGAEDISATEEYDRLAPALDIIRKHWPEIPISVDTFRSEVAYRCVEKWGVEIVNDISGGDLDPEMWSAVAELGCAYVLMHMRGNPMTMQSCCDYGDVTSEVISDLAFKLDKLRSIGVADVIVDPGFGFAKTTEQNFRILDELEHFKSLGCPILAGVSRKSMIWRTLDTVPAESLNGTTVLNTIALLKGANILRVHDVKEAMECVTLTETMRDSAESLQSR